MSDYMPQLQSLMQAVGIHSLRGLSKASGVSRWQLEQLRKGQIAQMRIEVLLKISQILQVSLTELINQFSDSPIAPSTTPDSADPQQLQQEYQRLQSQLVQQREQLQQEFQQASLQVLESWLLQFPTAAHAAHQNPQVPAARLLPLMRPIEQLLKQWDVEMLEPVGSEVPYDPQQHQLMEGAAQPGEMVKVRYAGYRQGDKLLYRAKVSAIANPS